MAYVDIQNGDDSDDILLKLNKGLALADKSATHVDTMQELCDLPTDLGMYLNATISGFHSADDGGGGPLHWDASRSKTEHNGGAIIDPLKGDQLGGSWPGTWFTPNASGVGCWVRQDLRYIDPRWFGIKGDGSTDETAILELCDLPGCLVLPENFTIRTTDIVSFENLTSIIGKGSSSGFFFDHGSRGIYFENRNDISLSNFKIYGTLTTPAFVAGRGGITFRGCTNVLINNLFIEDINTCGITLGDLNSDVNISNVNVSGAYEHGIYLAGETKNVNLSNIVLKNVGVEGAGAHVKMARVSDINLINVVSEGFGGILIDQNIEDASICENINLIGCNIENTDSIGAGLRIRNRCKNIHVVGGNYVGGDTGISVDNVNPSVRYPEGLHFSDLYVSGNSGLAFEIDDVRGFSLDNVRLHRTNTSVFHFIANAACENGSLRGVVTLSTGPGIRIISPSVRYVDGFIADSTGTEVQFLYLPLVISSGAITVCNSNNTVDTEGLAAADDLVTINGGYEGQIIALRCINASRVINVQSTGNIRIRPTSPFVLDNIHKQLFFDVFRWHLAKCIGLKPAKRYAGFARIPPGVQNIRISWGLQ